MMHLDDFEIEIRAEDFSGFAREPEQRVDPNAEIWSENNWDLRCRFFDVRDLCVRVAGRADDENFFVRRARCNDALSRRVMTKINHGIAAAERGIEVIVDVNFGSNAYGGIALRAGNHRLTHAAMRA